MIESLFQAAREARRQYEDMPTKHNLEAFLEARGEYRAEVVSIMRAKMAEQLTAYNLVAAEMAVVFEQIVQINRFFTDNGLDSGLPSNFIRDVNLPPTSRNGHKIVCGREARSMAFPFEELFTDEGQQMWDNTYNYYKKDAEPREAPFTPARYVRELNGPVGNG